MAAERQRGPAALLLLAAALVLASGEITAGHTVRAAGSSAGGPGLGRALRAHKQPQSVRYDQPFSSGGFFSKLWARAAGSGAAGVAGNAAAEAAATAGASASTSLSAPRRQAVEAVGDYYDDVVGSSAWNARRMDKQAALPESA